MALRIETFSNLKGGDAFFKALGHPLTARRAPAFFAGLEGAPVAVYDPYGFVAGVAELYDLSKLDIVGVYVQAVADLGRTVLGHRTQPVTDLPNAGARKVLVAGYDGARLIEHIRHLLPAGAEALSLDALRLPDDMLTNPRTYLDGLNFATNYAFFRDSGGHHTRLMTADYWSGYGAQAPEAWCCLFDEGGAVLAEWRTRLPGPNGAVVIDSAEVRERFRLGDFTGQLFVHVMRIAGHDIVKYALDTYGDDDEVLSCTHDANAWPADLYAGLPAPGDDETVILWVQNSHPTPIPAGSVGLNLMGSPEIACLEREVPAYGSYALDTRSLLPDARWPQQIEVRSGKHFVRPRYEVLARGGRRRIAHANVERTDLAPDPQIPDLANLLGKGFILPAPVLPTDRYRSIVLPTPMATGQAELPVRVLVYDPDGREVAAEPLGRLPRAHATALDVGDLLARDERDLDGGWGHVELVYDFGDGGEADGWLHGLFRYQDRASGHAAETSFGAHVFNTVLTYKAEPQSYAGRPPGLSTRLFLRLGPRPYDTFCHLIYPASTPWHPTSSTRLILYDRDGREVGVEPRAIPCGGSLLWRASEVFSAGQLETAAGGYVIVRDLTCRLFGYHGLLNGAGSFSLDHMFGF